MRVYLKLGDGAVRNLELEGEDTIAAVREKVAAVSGVHPEHQRIIYADPERGATELRDDAATVASFGIQMQADLRLGERPPPRVVEMNVGGTTHTTLLATLREVEGSRLDKMFDGVGASARATSSAAGSAAGPRRHVKRRPKVQDLVQLASSATSSAASSTTSNTASSTTSDAASSAMIGAAGGGLHHTTAGNNGPHAHAAASDPERRTATPPRPARLRPAQGELEPEVTRELRGMRHATAVPPSGRCWIASMIAQTDPDVPAEALDRLAATAWERCGLTQIPGSEWEFARIGAHVGARSARIMMVPGEAIWGVRLSARKPGTDDAAYRYALIRQVEPTHCCPLGPDRRTWSWSELREIAASYGMPIVSDNEGAWPAAADTPSLRKRRRTADRPRKDTLLAAARKIRTAIELEYHPNDVESHRQQRRQRQRQQRAAEDDDSSTAHPPHTHRTPTAHPTNPTHTRRTPGANLAESHRQQQRQRQRQQRAAEDDGSSTAHPPHTHRTPTAHPTHPTHTRRTPDANLADSPQQRQQRQPLRQRVDERRGEREDEDDDTWEEWVEKWEDEREREKEARIAVAATAAAAATAIDTCQIAQTGTQRVPYGDQSYITDGNAHCASTRVGKSR